MNSFRSGDFCIVYAEHYKNYDNHCRLHATRFELQYIAAGGVELCYDGKRYELRGGSGWLIHPGHYYDYRPLAPHGSWDHRFIVFEGARIERWREAGLFSLEPFAVPPALEFERRFDRIIGEARNQQSGLIRLDLANRVERLFLDLRLPEMAPQPEWLMTVLNRLEADRHPDYEQIARQCGMSLRTLLRHFRREMEMTPHQYHLQLRLRNATRLLETTDLSVAEIAGRLGFADAAHLTRQYRDATGTTPGSVRKK